ncbi:hypothetical protein E4U43_006454 [Claviceps pusilla]|uniref:Uncharacterized protein n=1 Tax=Claviceps pusilla TaxID=123648 RepID=A0A9P7N3F1_9HYPO|nr:hypothetical protein E4U43_006454 [Claviceps pusilla]
MAMISVTSKKPAIAEADDPGSRKGDVWREQPKPSAASKFFTAVYKSGDLAARSRNSAEARGEPAWPVNGLDSFDSLGGASSDKHKQNARQVHDAKRLPLAVALVSKRNLT